LSTIESYVSRWNGSIAKIDHFIAVSEFLRQKMIEFGVPGEKISTVHNFIDSSSVQPNYACGEYFLFFGRVEKIKGVETILKAAEICRALPIYIVGEGSAREEMESITERMGLQHVHFLGFQNGQRLQELISGACATLVPSEWYETFGLTIVESFAHGKPVIASRIGGMTEVVSDGQDGFLMQPGNAEEMAERMKWLIDNPAGAVAMGRSGRQKVEIEFGPEKHYQDLSQIYRQLVS
jgi:glycosyltransferase involved in cell wall biosynthesis